MPDTRSGRKLNGRVYIHPTEGSETSDVVVYDAGDVPSPEHAKLLGDHVWAPEEEDPNEDENAALRASNVPLARLLDRAKELGLEPGKGMPRNPSMDLVAQAIRYKEGRNTTSDLPGDSPAARDAQFDDDGNVKVVDGRTKEGRAAKANDSVVKG